MNERQILEELLLLLEGKGVIIRRERLGGGGSGLCNLRGKRIFFVDTESSTAESAAVCADAVSKLVDIEQIYIRPEVREYIEKHGE